MAFFTAATPLRTPQDALEKAVAAVNAGDLKAASQIVSEALTVFGSSDADAMWRLRNLRGMLYIYDAGDAPAAEAWLTGLKLPQRLLQSEIAAQRWLLLAKAQRKQAQTTPDKNAAAAESLTHAQVIAATAARDLLPDVLQERVSFEITRGQFDDADRAAQQLLAAVKKRPRPGMVARAWGTLSFLRGQQHRWDDAVEAERRALKIALAEQDHLVVNAAISQLSYLYGEVGDYESAAAVAKEIDDTYRLKGGDRVLPLLMRGKAAMAQRRFEQARSFYAEALRIAEPKKHENLAASYRSLALAELELGHIAAAQTNYARALQVQFKQRSILIEARIAAASGNTDRAIELLRSVVDKASEKHNWAAVAYLGQLYARQQNTAKAEDAYARAAATFEEAREQVKNEELRLSFPNIVADFFNNYIELLATANRAEDALRVAELRRARTLADAFNLSSDPAKLDVHGVNDVIAIEYALQSPRSWVWVVKSGEVSLFALESEEKIVEAIDAYQRTLRGPAGSLERSAGAGTRLYSMLIAPFASLLPRDAKVAVIADGRLNTLNMETLVVPGERPHYWIDDVTVESVPSLQLLARRRERAPAKAAMLLIGNPPGVDREFPPLPEFAREMALVRGHFPHAKVLSEKLATPRAYIANADDKFGFVHFVAHGIARSDRPLESAIILGNDGDSYRLYARDIATHPIAAQLVTIASCHGAGKRAYAGEGLVGLAWAFLRAGARNVVASLFEVDDRATVQLMDAMYTSMKNGSDPPSALREAKLKMIAKGGVQRYPRYWAPFVVYSAR